MSPAHLLGGVDDEGLGRTGRSDCPVAYVIGDWGCWGRPEVGEDLVRKLGAPRH